MIALSPGTQKWSHALRLGGPVGENSGAQHWMDLTEEGT
jgi:hypothetical protein